MSGNPDSKGLTQEREPCLTDCMTNTVDTARPKVKTSKKPAPLVISDEQNEIKIYTVKGRTGLLYQVAYYHGGQRVRKTFADLNEAKREARLQLGTMAGERIQARNLTAAEMERYTFAARTLEPTGIPLHVCAEIFAKAHCILEGNSLLNAAEYFMKHYNPKRPRKPMPDLVEEFMEARRAMGLSQQYLDHLTYVFRNFLKAVGNIALDDLTHQQVEKWLESRQSIGLCTRRTFRIILVAFGNFLKQRGYLTEGRPSVFEQVTKYREPTTSVRIYTPDELRKLLEGAHEFLLPVVAIGAFAGLRSAEIARLDWKHVRFDRGFIECEAAMTKTRRRRLVPITDNLRAWIEPLSVPEGPIVMHRKLASAFLLLGARCGIPWKKNALRHSYISYRLAQLPDTATVALECGNSPDVIFSHYRELTTPEQAKEWFSIKPPMNIGKPIKPNTRSFLTRIFTPATIDNRG